MIANASSIVKCIFQIKSGIMKNYRTCTKNYGWNTSTYICKNGKYLKSIANTSVVLFDGIIKATDSVSTKYDRKCDKYDINKYDNF